MKSKAEGPFRFIISVKNCKQCFWYTNFCLFCSNTVVFSFEANYEWFVDFWFDFIFYIELDPQRSIYSLSHSWVVRRLFKTLCLDL